MDLRSHIFTLLHTLICFCCSNSSSACLQLLTLFYCHKPVNLFSISHYSFSFRVHKITHFSLTSIPAETRTRFFILLQTQEGTLPWNPTFRAKRFQSTAVTKVNRDGQPQCQPTVQDGSPAPRDTRDFLEKPRAARP